MKRFIIPLAIAAISTQAFAAQSQTFDIWKTADGINAIDKATLLVETNSSLTDQQDWISAWGVRHDLQSPSVGSLNVFSLSRRQDGYNTITDDSFITQSYHIKSDGDWNALANLFLVQRLSVDNTVSFEANDRYSYRFAYGAMDYEYQIKGESGQTLKSFSYRQLFDSHTDNYSFVTDLSDINSNELYIDTKISWIGGNGIRASFNPECMGFYCMPTWKDIVAPVYLSSELTAGGPFVTTAAVPEPESLALSLVGLTVLGFARRRIV